MTRTSFLLQGRTATLTVEGRVEFTQLKVGGSKVWEWESRRSLRTV